MYRITPRLPRKSRLPGGLARLPAEENALAMIEMRPFCHTDFPVSMES